ncbi:hypothetical protein ACFWE5_07170 [Cellulosimicrobium funkei]|uniref:hypothetical protein n=1 Tax=Cellulosimicrobium funkei TaxID=264251 RepID=UPI003650ADBD
MARTATTPATDPTTPPAPAAQPDVVTAAPEPAAAASSPSARQRPVPAVPTGQVVGDVVRYGAVEYSIPDAVELGLIPPQDAPATGQ